MRNFLIEKEYQGYTVAAYLKEIEGYSSRLLRELEIYLNKKRLKKNSKKLRYRDMLKVKEKVKGTNIKDIELDLKIVYENSQILIINKPPYLLTHPTLKKVDVTLANGIVHYFNELEIPPVPRFYNRLDMNTSGMLIVAKTAFAQGFLQNRGEVEKEYMTIVKGIVKEKDIVVEKPIGLGPDGIRRVIDEKGQYAKTTIKVVETNEEEDISILRVKLHTGRTHQIRVHLSSLGHPILGDELYGGGDSRAKRQLLHSFSLKFINPLNKQIEEIEISLPDDMEKFMKRLREKN